MQAPDLELVLPVGLAVRVMLYSSTGFGLGEMRESQKQKVEVMRRAFFGHAQDGDPRYLKIVSQALQKAPHKRSLREQTALSVENQILSLVSRQGVIREALATSPDQRSKEQRQWIARMRQRIEGLRRRGVRVKCLGQ